MAARWVHRKLGAPVNHCGRRWEASQGGRPTRGRMAFRFDLAGPQVRALEQGGAAQAPRSTRYRGWNELAKEMPANLRAPGGRPLVPLGRLDAPVLLLHSIMFYIHGSVSGTAHQSAQLHRSSAASPSWQHSRMTPGTAPAPPSPHAAPATASTASGTSRRVTTIVAVVPAELPGSTASTSSTSCIGA